MEKMCHVMKQLKQFQSSVKFMPNRCYAYLLNVEPNNLVFSKIYNTDFVKIIITFTDENGRPLEKEDKINLIISKKQISIEANILQNQERENMLRDMNFCHLLEIYLRNMAKKCQVFE